MGDERDTLETLYMRDGQYLANRNWINPWIDESKSVYELYKELGLAEQYTDANVTGFAEKDDCFGYRDFVGPRLRHKRVLPALLPRGVTVVEQTMIYDVVKKNDRVIGAVGFHVPNSNGPGWHPPLWSNPHPDDVRNNRVSTDEPKNSAGGTYGAAPGFCAHTTSGIFCGVDDTHGYTGIPGLYCAGDGCNGGPVGGATYAGRTGFTSNFFGVQGKRSSEAASEYIQNIELEKNDAEALAAVIEEYTAPMRLEKGYDVTWALDCLQGIMVPFWTLLAKSEARLKAALVNVCYMRDYVLPKVMAMDPHDLRFCSELKNKVLEAEMKLRVSLARKESRGNHYRTDYPFRDDANCLCYFAAVKQSDGTMGVDRIEIPDSWKGDLNEPYETRYNTFFPGEKEAAAAHGLL